MPFPVIPGMIALDTNILVRFVTHDDSPQTERVFRLLARPSESFFISNLALAELVWVLGYCYHWTRAEVADALLKILHTNNVVVEDEEQVELAVLAYQRSGDLADHLLVATARQQGCNFLASFDRDLAKAHLDFVQEPK